MVGYNRGQGTELGYGSGDDGASLLAGQSLSNNDRKMEREGTAGCVGTEQGRSDIYPMPCP